MKYFRPEIQALAGYVPGYQPRPVDEVIKLNTNENPYPPSPRVIEAIEAQARQGLQRYPSPMADPFREQASKVLGVPADWILAGNGSDDILTICTRAFVGQDEMLRSPYPSYILYRTLAEIQGANIDFVRFQEDWSLADDFAAEPEGKNLRLAVVPNPNSPSGTFIEPEAIYALAQKMPCPILIDEAYVDFADRSCIELVARDERIMVCRTLSKSYGLAGLRFGYVVAQPHMIEELTKVKDSYNCDALAIAGATAALADQDWLAENRARILATRRRLVDAMTDLGFEQPESKANFTWNIHPDASHRTIAEKLADAGIYVRYMNYDDYGDGIRVSVGTDRQIDLCVSKIAEIINRAS